tara:strand:- start:1700 stop:1918 length:219 start_codon:yes stop_codon:yes gene_type:complete
MDSQSESLDGFIKEKDIECPNCGEIISVIIDQTIKIQEYTEDCSVCCQTMIIRVNLDDEFNRLSISNEQDTF